MIFLVILFLLYICLLCVPAFFITYEKSTFDGCDAIIWVILGFPGALLAYIIRENKDADQRAKYEEGKRQSEIAAREQARRIALLRADRIDYYTKSSLLPEIIKFVTMHGTPYSVGISHREITVERLNGTDVYCFAKHGIQNLPENSIDAYALGCVINNALDNQFTLKEFRYSDNGVGVDLIRPLNKF